MSRLFAIPVSGIKDGHHIFEFEITKEFFDLFDESEIKEGELAAVVNVEKNSSHLDLDISISGKVRTCCDRCLGMFDYPVECVNRLLVKFGLNEEESDPDIITIPRDEYELDLKQYIYEFVYLALPIRRIHPDNADGTSTCDPVMLQKLNEHLVEGEDVNDPRWDKLRNLINDN